MNVSGNIIWKDEVVGKVSNLMNDMWYFEGDWIPTDSDHSSEFIAIAGKLDARAVIESPSKGFLAYLKYEDSPSELEVVLITSLADSKLSMRIMTSRATAAYVDLSLLEPWASVENSAFYEDELKNEVGFLHPLKWKRVRAIGRRTDCDDVLYEVPSGNTKYAVVHLTYSKKRKHKFPKTKFYMDWMDVYENRLLQDHSEWKKDFDH